MKLWYCIGVGGIGLLFLTLVIASKFSKVRAEEPDHVLSDAHSMREEAGELATISKENSDKTDQIVNMLQKKIDTSLHDDDAKKQAGESGQQQAQQNGTNPQVQQMQAYQEYLRTLQSVQQPRSASDQDGQKSFVMSFREDAPSRPTEPTLSPAPMEPSEPTAKSPEPEGGFACGSEENYLTACIPEGSVIMAVMTNELRGDFTGPVLAKVSQALMSKDLKSVLVPAGTSVLGESGRVEGQDQKRLAIVFHRLILSAGSSYHSAGWSIKLDKLQGLSVDGSAGQEGHVNHHMVSALLTAGAYGALAGFSLAGTGSELTAGGLGMYRQGVSQSFGMQGETMLGHFLNQMPTVTVPVGSECDVYFSRDVLVK